MTIFRFFGVLLLSTSLLITGVSSGVAVQPTDDELLLPLPDGVWIRGTKVKLVDTKLCWAKSEKPVLYAKVGGNFKEVARGKLVKRSKCIANFPKSPYQAEYRFKLKDGGGAKKLTLRSNDGSGVNATFKRTVYSSVSEYNDTAAGLLGFFQDALTGDSESPSSSPGGVSPSGTSGWAGCYFDGQKMWGTVKIIEIGLADFEVKIDDYFPDIKVKETPLPTSCGEWKVVTSGLADFTIKFVNYFPGR